MPNYSLLGHTVLDKLMYHMAKKKLQVGSLMFLHNTKYKIYPTDVIICHGNLIV